MSLKNGGATPTKIMVAGTPATKIMSGGVVVWQAIRKVTITAGTTSAFTQGSETGSTSLISSWTGSGTTARVVFSVNVVCDKPTLNSTGSIVQPGSTIPAGIGFRPTSSGGTGLYVFTEVV